MATQTIKMPKRFDYSSSGEFNSVFSSALNASAEAKQVFLDCFLMDYIDSAGIGLLVMSHKKAQANRATISMLNVKPSVKEILLLANLQKLIDIK